MWKLGFKTVKCCLQVNVSLSLLCTGNLHLYNCELINQSNINNFNSYVPMYNFSKDEQLWYLTQQIWNISKRRPTVSYTVSEIQFPFINSLQYSKNQLENHTWSQDLRKFGLPNSAYWMEKWVFLPKVPLEATKTKICLWWGVGGNNINVFFWPKNFFKLKLQTGKVCAEF